MCDKKNCAYLGGCYPPASTENTLLDQHYPFSTVARKGHYNIFFLLKLSRDKFKLSRDNFELSRHK